MRLAVDDFGTGYSSLQYLRRLPARRPQDRQVVRGRARRRRSGRRPARAIVDLGESCRLDVVGEGIELHDQREQLLELGCQLGQGFLFARPAAASHVDALLGERCALDAVELPKGVNVQDLVPPVD